MPIDPNHWGHKLETGQDDDPELRLAARLAAERGDPPMMDEDFRRKLRATLTTRPAARSSWRFALVGGGLAAAAALFLVWLILARPPEVAEPAPPTPPSTWDLTELAPCVLMFGPMPGTPEPASIVATRMFSSASNGYPGLNEEGWFSTLEAQVAAQTQALPMAQTQYVDNCMYPRTPTPFTPEATATPWPTNDLTPGAGLPPGLVFQSAFDLFRIDADGQAHGLGPLGSTNGTLSGDGQREYFIDHTQGSAPLTEIIRSTGERRIVVPAMGLLSDDLVGWLTQDQRLIVTGLSGFQDLLGSIGIVDAARGEVQVVTDQVPGNASVAFSPDGSRVAYTRAQDIVILELTTGQSLTIALPDLADGATVIGHLGWSRDGARLAIETGVRTAQGETWRVVTLYDGDTGELVEAGRQPGEVIHSRNVIAWSPTNDWLAVPVFQAFDIPPTQLFGSCFVKVTGSGTTWCSDELVAWSPDGSQAVVSNALTGNKTLVQIGSWQTRALTGFPVGSRVIRWDTADQSIPSAPTWTFTPTPTPTAPLAYLWPVRLPAGYRIIGVTQVSEQGFTIDLLPPQSGREGGFALINTLAAGDGISDKGASASAEGLKDAITIRGQPGWIEGTTVCWIELGNSYCLSLMQGDVAEIQALAEGLDVVSEGEWQALRQALHTPTPVPYVTSTPAAALPSLPAGIGYTTAGQAWEVDAAGLAQFRGDVPTGARIASNGETAIFERDGDLWALEMASGDIHNVTSSPSRIESGARWWLERPGTLGYVYSEVGTPPAGLDFPPTFAAIIQIDGSGQQTISGPMDFLSWFDLGHDGDTVVYLLEGRILVRRLSEAEPRTVEIGAGIPPGAKILNPCLSPDLGWIAARLLERWSTDNLGQAVLLIDTATGATRTLGHEPMISEGRSLGAYPGLWTPDSAWVLLFDESDYQHGLRPVRVADGLLADILPGDVVAFSPDGTQAIVHEIYRRDAAEQGYVLYDTQNWRALGRLPIPVDAEVLYWH